ncbi:MAG: anti-sigma factor family protein [Candidatus Binatia bacterium]
MAGKHHTKKTRRESVTCKGATSLIDNYLNEDLAPGVKLLFEEHLRACPDCVAFLNTYKKTLELARSFLDAGLEDTSLERIEASVVENVRKRDVSY